MMQVADVISSLDNAVLNWCFPPKAGSLDQHHQNHLGTFKISYFSGPTLGSNLVSLGWGLCFFTLPEKSPGDSDVEPVCSGKYG